MADADPIARLTRLVRLSLAANAAMLVVNVGLAYWLLVFVVNEPATVEGVSVAASTGESTSTNGDPREEMRSFFVKTGTLLDRAARRHGTNPADVMPTKEEFDAAVESRTMHSAESEIVLQKLKEGYDYYNLTWPVAVPNR